MDGSICVLGLGLMGRPIARTLLAAGYGVVGWNRSPLPEQVVAGVALARTMKDAASASICLLVLADSIAVDAVLRQLEPHLPPGGLVIDMGTSDPSRSRAHASRLTAKGIGWVDAPVSGGPEGAAKSSLAIMAGGAGADLARGRPIPQEKGRGGPGGEAVAEALTLAEKVGLDPRLVQKALAGGFADSKILQVHGSRMIDRSYAPGGRARTQLKDLNLAQQLAARVSVRLPHLDSALSLYQTLVDRGDGDLDHSAVHKLLQ